MPLWSTVVSRRWRSIARRLRPSDRRVDQHVGSAPNHEQTEHLLNHGDLDAEQRERLLEKQQTGSAPHPELSPSQFDMPDKVIILGKALESPRQSETPLQLSPAPKQNVTHQGHAKNTYDSQQQRQLTQSQSSPVRQDDIQTETGTPKKMEANPDDVGISCTSEGVSPGLRSGADSACQERGDGEDIFEPEPQSPIYKDSSTPPRTQIPMERSRQSDRESSSSDPTLHNPKAPEHMTLSHYFEKRRSVSTTWSRLARASRRSLDFNYFDINTDIEYCQAVHSPPTVRHSLSFQARPMYTDKRACHVRAASVESGLAGDRWLPLKALGLDAGIKVDEGAFKHEEKRVDAGSECEGLRKELDVLRKDLDQMKKALKGMYSWRWESLSPPSVRSPSLMHSPVQDSEVSLNARSMNPSSYLNTIQALQTDLASEIAEMECEQLRKELGLVKSDLNQMKRALEASEATLNTHQTTTSTHLNTIHVLQTDLASEVAKRQEVETELRMVKWQLTALKKKEQEIKASEASEAEFLKVKLRSPQPLRQGLE